MATINRNYGKLEAGYLFPEIGRRTREFIAANPESGWLPLAEQKLEELVEEQAPETAASPESSD